MRKLDSRTFSVFKVAVLQTADLKDAPTVVKRRFHWSQPRSQGGLLLPVWKSTRETWERHCIGVIVVGWQSGQCKTQTADYCFHHANQYETTIVPLYSNPKNSSPQSVRSPHFLHCHDGKVPILNAEKDLVTVALYIHNTRGWQRADVEGISQIGFTCCNWKHVSRMRFTSENDANSALSVSPGSCSSSSVSCFTTKTSKSQLSCQLLFETIQPGLSLR